MTLAIMIYDLTIRYLNYQWLSWLCSHCSWIYNYICNRSLWPLMLWVRIPLRARCTTLFDKVCQWLAAGLWFSLGAGVSSTNKTDRHDITEIVLKVALNTIKPTNLNTAIINLEFFLNRLTVTPNCARTTSNPSTVRVPPSCCTKSAILPWPVKNKYAIFLKYS